jgi:hypothetical protein
MGSNDASMGRHLIAVLNPDAFANKRGLDPGRVRLVDAWITRESFLEIKTSEDALRFFNQCGLIFQLSRPRKTERHFVALFSDILRCQKMIVDALVSPISEHLKKGFPAEWQYGLGTLPLMLRVIDDKPTAEFLFRDGLEAIMAAVQIDKAWGAEFQRCLRCGRVYQKESRHERLYCGYDCGHAAAEQERRNRSRKANRPTTENHKEQRKRRD